MVLIINQWYDHFEFNQFHQWIDRMNNILFRLQVLSIWVLHLGFCVTLKHLTMMMMMMIIISTFWSIHMWNNLGVVYSPLLTGSEIIIVLRVEDLHLILSWWWWRLFITFCCWMIYFLFFFLLFIFIPHDFFCLVWKKITFHVI